MLAKAHRTREAIEHYRRALELAPDSVPAMNSLAWLLVASPDPTLRNSAEALELARRANQLTNRNNPTVLRTLAAALAASGRSSEAAATAELALEFARDNESLTHALEADLRIYTGT
jgi:tetratricopeptide (TPR) repeat protein